MAAKKMSLEECFEGLDDIIVDLQSGELSLEDGMKLIKKCTETIDKVEKKLIVVENEQE